MANSSVIRFDALKSLAFGSIGAAYSAVGEATTQAAQMIIIKNTTDTEMMFSFDGTVDHFVLSAGEGMVLDLTTNKEATINAFYLRKGSTLYVKQISAPSSGSVYFSVIY